MNHLKFLFIAVVLAVFASCSQSDVEGGMLANANRAEFSGAIDDVQTRVSGDNWVAGDLIGIYAINHGETLGEDGAIFGRFANVKYTTNAAGKFTVASGGSPIVYPPTGKDLNFVAYYPWKEAIADYTYPIDVSTQVFADIDLLYVNEANAGHNKDNAGVNLSFNHMLSKVVVKIQKGDYVDSLEGLTVSMDNVVVDGTLALADGAIAIGENKATITPVIEFGSEEKDVAAIVAMVVPGQNLNDVTFNFTLGDGEYTWTPNEQVLLSSKQYVYKLKIHADGVELLIEQPTISSWKEGYKGTDFIDVNSEEILFSIDGGNLIFDAVPETVSSVEVTTNDWLEWSATSNADWLTVTPATGRGSGAVEIAATENSNERSREATITLKLKDFDEVEPIVIAVRQAGDDGGFATDLFFSEYIEGSSNNKYLEIYNGTGATVDLTDYRVELYSNGATTAGSTEMLTGTLENGKVLVLKNSNAAIYDGAATTSGTTNFNGDDAVALIKISTGDYVDIIGRIGERPDKKWSAGGDLETMDKTLVRKPSVKSGVTVNPSVGFPTLATEWIGYPIDTATHLGSHSMD